MNLKLNILLNSAKRLPNTVSGYAAADWKEVGNQLMHFCAGFVRLLSRGRANVWPCHNDRYSDPNLRINDLANYLDIRDWDDEFSPSSTVFFLLRKNLINEIPRKQDHIVRLIGEQFGRCNDGNMHAGAISSLF